MIDRPRSPLFPIHTPRQRLRPFVTVNAEEIHATRRDPAVWTHIDGVDASKSITETRKRIERFIACQQTLGFSFAVTDKHTGALLGDCGLIPRDLHGPEIELGYRLGREHWGKGTATEATAACLHVGFHDLGLDRILAVARAEHTASRRVMEKLGMTHQTTRDRDAVYAITRAQFERIAGRVRTDPTPEGWSASHS